jgi:hypothetical protein
VVKKAHQDSTSTKSSTRRMLVAAVEKETQGAVVQQVGGTHYTACSGQCPHCGKEIQHWDLFARMPYLESQICRYILRWLQKNGLEDLDKAQSFLTKLRGVLALPPVQRL